MLNIAFGLNRLMTAAPASLQKPGVSQSPRFSGSVDDFLKKEAPAIRKHHKGTRDAAAAKAGQQQKERQRLLDKVVVGEITGQDLCNYLETTNSPYGNVFVDDQYIDQAFGPHAETVKTALAEMVEARIVDKGIMHDPGDGQHDGVYSSRYGKK